MFGRKKKAQSASTPVDAATVLGNNPLLQACLDDIAPGFERLPEPKEHSLEVIRTALADVMAFGLASHDEGLLLLLRRISISYGIYLPESELSNAEWAFLMITNTEVVVEYRERFLSLGRPDLERGLSIVAVTAMKVLKTGDRFEPIMDEVMQQTRNQMA